MLKIDSKLQPDELENEEELEIKKVARVLYIEADEDLVAHREKGVPAFEQRLVYVIEGRV